MQATTQKPPPPTEAPTQVPIEGQPQFHFTRRPRPRNNKAGRMSARGLPVYVDKRASGTNIMDQNRPCVFSLNLCKFFINKKS